MTRHGGRVCADEACGHCGADLTGHEIVPWSGLVRCPRCHIATEPVDRDGLTAMDRYEMEDA